MVIVLGKNSAKDLFTGYFGWIPDIPCINPKKFLDQDKFKAA